jgi:hypothetical protein
MAIVGVGNILCSCALQVSSNPLRLAKHIQFQMNENTILVGSHSFKRKLLHRCIIGVFLGLDMTPHFTEAPEDASLSLEISPSPNLY